MDYRPRDFYARNRVRARLGTAAVGVDTAQRRVRLADGEEIGYERLLIATGGGPFVPPVEGGEAEGVFTFTSWDDVNAINACLARKAAKRAVVIGGGLIGIKAAEALRARGLDVVIVELADRLLPLALDEKGSALASRAAEEAGVALECRTTVERILTEAGTVSGALLKNGKEIACEMVIMAIGVAPNLGVVRESEIETERGVLINDRCETNVPGVFAAGDVAQGMDCLEGRSRPVAIFPNAYRQGHAAGVNMAGGDATADGLFAMNAVEVFGLPTISVGLAAASGDGCEVVEHLAAEERVYRRLVLRGDRLVGALFVGDIDRAGIVTGLIRERVTVAGCRDLLVSDEFGLISLPESYRKHLMSPDGIEI